MRIFAFLTVFGVLTATAVPLRAQSLVDVAKNEEVAAPGPAADAAPPADKAADTKVGAKADAKVDEKPAAKGDKAGAKSEVKDRDYWNARMQARNEQLERDRLYAEALQSRINALTAEFAGRDDPAQRATIGLDREKAVAELSRLRRIVEDDKDAIGAVEEEARKAGVPPGWLR
jgi:hypothetical protein